MSYTSGFFDAVDLGEGQYDRVYSSAEFAHYFGLFVGNGVFPSPSTGLSVVCNDPKNMMVKVSPGSGFINGHYLSVPEGGDEYLTIPIAHASLTRIDSIIMGLDLGERQVTLYVRQGVAATSPEPVSLQRDDTIYELELARITVMAGAGSISQADILDTRPDPDRCGLVTGLVDQFDVSGFFQAAYASFEEWFAEIKGQVNEDIAVSLQLQVNELRAQIQAQALTGEVKQAVGLPPEASTSETFLQLYALSGAHLRNRPPLTTDSDRAGRIWMVPKMTFHNLMPNALTQSTGSWSSTTASLSTSGSSITAVGNAADSKTQIQVQMSPALHKGDKVFLQANVRVNHDANSLVAELVVGSTVLVSRSLEVPAAGATLALQALTTSSVAGNPILRVYSSYNTSAVQSGKGFTVSDITVWNLTQDMCEAQEGNEFSESEAASYISSFGRFQTREYEYSTWWWVLRGITNGEHLWVRMFDVADSDTAKAGVDGTTLMSPLRTQEFFTSHLATQVQAEAGSNNTQAMTPLRTQNFLTKKIASQDEVNAGTDGAKVVTPATAAGLFTNRLASTTEAQAGSVDTKWMSPLKTQQFLTSKIATQSEVNTGTNTTKVVTPSTAAGLFTNKLATTAEAQAGTSDAKWMSPLKTQQFFTNRLATQAEADAGTSTTKAMTPALVKRRANPYYASNIGDVLHTANNAEEETNGAFIRIDGRTIDVNTGYPLLKDAYELGYRIANPTSLTVSGHLFSCSPYQRGSAWLGSSFFFTAEYAQSTSSSYYSSLCIRKSNGAVTRLLSDSIAGLVESNGQIVCCTYGDQKVAAVVYDSSGNQVRKISLNSSTSGVASIHQFGSRTFILFHDYNYIYGYYSDDNFSTYGTSTWAGSASYGYSKSPWFDSYPGMLTGVQQSSDGYLYLVVGDGQNSNTPYTRVMRSTDLGKTWTILWSLNNNEVTTRVPYSSGWFIDGNYIYLNGYCQEKVDSSTYQRQVLLKYQLSNGAYVSQTPSLYNSSNRELYGFIQDGYAYLSGQYWSYVVNLSNMTISPWRIFGDKVIDMRQGGAYLTKNGRYWISHRYYTGYVPSYGGITTTAYGGLLVYDTLLHKAVYLTGEIYTTSNNHSPYIGAFCEDSSGVVYAPHGYQSDNKFYQSKILKLDFNRKTLPELDYAYLKAKEMT